MDDRAEDVIHDLQDAVDREPWHEAFEDMRSRPMYYRRDGSVIMGSDDDPHGTLEWAKMFEDTKGRIVGQTKTLYGEKLSTVFLGLDHSFSMTGPPILFETMLFAPESNELRKAKRDRLRKIAEIGLRKSLDALDIEWEPIPEEEYIKKHYPHDQLQQRYCTDAQAQAGHRRLKLQCLVPPRWRRFFLYTIGRDSLWSH